MIYLDNSATTPMHDSVIEVMAKVQKSYVGNPSSLHQLGVSSQNLLQKARTQVADLLKVFVDEITFTSGGTESNNTAILGTVFEKTGKHIITTAIEHPSVMNVMRFLEKQGYNVTVLPVDKNGQIDCDTLKNAITKDTCLVSIMWVNNEVGTIQPIDDIATILEKHPNIHFHVDAVQALEQVVLHGIPKRVDLLTLSAHKFHGPKGVGVLYKKSGRVILPLLNGGGQEKGLRNGTENVAGIIATARALREYVQKQSDVKLLSTQLKKHLTTYSKVILLTPSDTEKVASHIITFALPGVRGEVMVHALEEHGVYVSTTSACSSRLKNQHHTLGAMRVSNDIATCAVRISLSKWTTQEDVEQFMKVFEVVYTQFQKIVK